MSKRNSSKLTSIEEIGTQIASGDMLAFGYLHSWFESLFEAFAEFNWDSNVSIFILGTLGYRESDIFHLDKVCTKLNARFLVPQIAPDFAASAKQGGVEILPLPLSQTYSYLAREAESRRVWLFCEVGAPDEKGFCNTGSSAPFPQSLYKDCRLIGLINDEMPPTYGDTTIPVSAFDHLVNLPASRLPLYPEPLTTEVMQRIGQNVVELVEDGSTIQVGVGGVIPSIIKALSSKMGLRIRSGILPDDVRGLIEKGIVVDKCVANVTGAYSPDFYNWLRMNPAVEIKTLDYTHNILLLSQQYKFTSIGSAVCVDLLGQVACETIGPTQITGSGGALDFARAAELSSGKRIIAMSSVYGKKESPRIVPLLDKGDVVTLTRYDIDYVVTECGIAELKYKPRSERAVNLIRVAHPQHQEWLQKQAAKLGLI